MIVDEDERPAPLIVDEDERPAPLIGDEDEDERPAPLAFAFEHGRREGSRSVSIQGSTAGAKGGVVYARG
ncbi:MAG: hypothetical protein GY946_25020 [bacterium]|nr:hypothetical protein [bacterium]